MIHTNKWYNLEAKIRQTDSSLSLTATVAGQVPKPTLQSQLGNRSEPTFQNAGQISRGWGLRHICQAKIQPASWTPTQAARQDQQFAPLRSPAKKRNLKSIWRKCHNMHQGKLVRRKDWSVSTIGSFSDTNLGANIIHLFLSQYDRFCDWEESLHFTGMKTDSTPARVTPRRIKGATWRFVESSHDKAHSFWRKKNFCRNIEADRCRERHSSSKATCRNSAAVFYLGGHLCYNTKTDMN